MKISKKIVSGCVCLSALVALTACHPSVTPVSKMDNQLSCADLSKEIKDVEAIKAKIESKRGFSARNVGLGLVFWPGVIVNEVTGNKAENEANLRLAALKNIYADKKCSTNNK